MKKIIAEDKFGWPIERTLAEAEGAWIILVDGEFFVSANKTSDESPDAKVFKDRQSAVEAVKKNNLNKKGRVQIADTKMKFVKLLKLLWLRPRAKEPRALPLARQKF